jgi:hypothetical protein
MSIRTYDIYIHICVFSDGNTSKYVYIYIYIQDVYIYIYIQDVYIYIYIQVGSGSTNFNVDKGGAVFFGNLLDMDESPEGQQAFKLEQEAILRDKGVQIKDLEHLYYFKEFIKCFPTEEVDGGGRYIYICINTYIYI